MVLLLGLHKLGAIREFEREERVFNTGRGSYRSKDMEAGIGRAVQRTEREGI